jgi:hypothetical protein
VNVVYIRTGEKRFVVHVSRRNNQNHFPLTLRLLFTRTLQVAQGDHFISSVGKATPRMK